MWHRKGKNFLLLVEIFFSFMVLFATLTMVIKQFQNYFSPLGFDYRDIWVIEFDPPGEDFAGAKERMEQIGNFIKSMPEIASHSFSSGNTPYAFENNTLGLQYEGNSSILNNYVVGTEYFETLDLELAAGRWMEEGDIGEVSPAVINEAAAKSLFREESPLGKILMYDGKTPEFKVIGVIKHFRQMGEFSEDEGALFRLYTDDDQYGLFPRTILVESKPNAEIGWQERLSNEIKNIAGGWSFKENAMTEQRSIRASGSGWPLPGLL